MTENEIGELIRAGTPKAFWMEALDEIVARTRAADKVIREGFDLSASRQGRAIGFVRFQLNEQGFEMIGGRHGAENLLKQCLPGSDRVVYQPFQKFGSIIVGFAQHSEPGALPAKNQSRGAAVQGNFHFMDHLDVETVPTAKTLFVVLLASRDRNTAGAVRAVEVAVIDPSYDMFVFRQPIERFVMAYEVAPAEAAEEAERKPLVKLRATPVPIEERATDSNKGADTQLKK